MYNNATERTKVVYVGSLAGVVPGGPGHSHQSVRDIAALGAIPGLVLMEPSCEKEVEWLLDWALNVNPGSSYLRLASLPCAIPFELPPAYRPAQGRGVVLREGSDVVVVGYGPVLLASAYEAATVLEEEQGLGIRLINLPWLNGIDAAWLREAIGTARDVVSLDNHYAIGGQGDRIAEVLASFGGNRCRLHRIAVDDVPACGTNAEVLSVHGLDAKSLATRIGTCLHAQTAA
jgi:transketolase